MEKYRHCDFVFEGESAAEYSPSSLQNIIKAAAQKAGIQKNTTMHNLRHTFSTHCLENRVDLRYIQNMLGHDSTKTIEIVTQVTTKAFDQIERPLDKLDI
jgi:integrase/recombinase XerD